MLANAVVGKAEPTQAEVDNAAKVVKEAIKALKVKDNGTTNPEEPKDVITIVIDENGNKVIKVSEIVNKSGRTIIEINDEGKSVIVEVTDLEALKNAEGSLEIKSNKYNIVIPFSTINSSLLEDGSKLIFDLLIEDGGDLTKNIKGLKKVFNFNLAIVNGDTKTIIHNFANGEAEITLILTDEELKGLDKNNLIVFYYNEQANKFEAMETRVEGNNVTFKTSHFSKFIIAEKAIDNSGVTLPDTGSPISTSTLLLIGILSIGAGITLRRKYSVQK